MNQTKGLQNCLHSQNTENKIVTIKEELSLLDTMLANMIPLNSRYLRNILTMESLFEWKQCQDCSHSQNTKKKRVNY